MSTDKNAESRPEPEPLGRPIYDVPPVPDTERPDRIVPGEGSANHVVVTPQTAGSSGTVHTED